MTPPLVSMWCFSARSFRLATRPYIDGGKIIDTSVSTNVIPCGGMVACSVVYKSYPAAYVDPSVGMIACSCRLTILMTTLGMFGVVDG